MKLRLLQQLEQYARARRGAHAIHHVDGSGEMSHAQLWQAVRAVARRLGAIEPGAVVMLSCPNRVEYTAAFLGVLMAGATVFPVTPELVTVELQTAAQRSRAKGIIGSAQAIDAVMGLPLRVPLEELIAVCRESPGELADQSDRSGGLLLQSSGTTGLPKIVRRSIESLDAVSANMVEAVGFRSDDHVLATVPLCHSYGMEHGLLAPVWAGSCVHLCCGFDLPQVTRELRAGAITVFPGVPFMFEVLANAGGAPGRLASLRRTYSAGGPLPAAIYEAFVRRYGVRVAQLYGATEIGSVAFNDPDDPHFDPAAVGKAMRGVSIKVLDFDEPQAASALPPGTEGQVVVATPSMLNEYLGDAMPLVDGHFITGDLGRLDEHGALTITGRLKLLINVGGLKVNPLEVEQVLSQHPDVGDCVVIPVALSSTVTRLKAVVTARDPAAGVPIEDLRRFARERLTGYKVPRVVEVRASLPKTPTGKVLRNLVES